MRSALCSRPQSPILFHQRLVRSLRLLFGLFAFGDVLRRGDQSNRRRSVAENPPSACFQHAHRSIGPHNSLLKIERPPLAPRAFDDALTDAAIVWMNLL